MTSQSPTFSPVIEQEITSTLLTEPEPIASGIALYGHLNVELWSDTPF